VLVPAGEELRNMFTLLVNREASTALRRFKRWIRPQQLEKSGS
jgi:hypothetical protein